MFGGGCDATPTRTVEEFTMKRILMALLALTMVFGSAMVTGCSKAGDDAAQPAAAEEGEAEAEGGEGGEGS
jgi:hypothetical protein